MTLHACNLYSNKYGTNVVKLTGYLDSQVIHKISRVLFADIFTFDATRIIMGKTKNDTLNDSSVNGSGPTYNDLLKNLSPIAKPLATKKLTKRIYKCVKKGSKQKKFLKIGIKQVTNEEFNCVKVRS